MVYANVPEHEGFNEKGAKEAYEADVAAAPRSVEELLTSIDSKMGFFVDALTKAQADSEEDEDGTSSDASTSGGSDAGRGDGSTEPPAPPSGDGDKPAPAKKATVPPKKQTEVKGD